jgi:uncharacterized membrane protein (UPF0182 family)
VKAQAVTAAQLVALVKVALAVLVAQTVITTPEVTTAAARAKHHQILGRVVLVRFELFGLDRLELLVHSLQQIQGTCDGTFYPH